jgi:hypothetical protein
MPHQPDACFATPATTKGGVAALVLSPRSTRPLASRGRLLRHGSDCRPAGPHGRVVPRQLSVVRPPDPGPLVLAQSASGREIDLSLQSM